ncbi:hypothetical protein [Kordia jejudonensis]|uniref:hypothetical protein n=1 Tax=Kordia jejudonensis TaxID=1348245 RepID=UPI0006290DF7|nr:hypothetical protein [Kordia jejudonensis]
MYRINEFFKIFIRYFKSKNPQLIKKYIYNKEHKIIEKLSQDNFNHQAQKYNLLGDFYWSKSSIASGTIAGWYYVLSAECYEKNRDYKKAGYLYHFAGNQFRRIGTLEKAMKFYFISAKIHFEVKEVDQKIVEMAHRSTRRAIGLSKSSGDEEILKNWMEDRICFSKYVEQFKKQNIWD